MLPRCRDTRRPVTIGPSDVPKLLVLGHDTCVGSHLAVAGHRTGMHVLGFSRDTDIERGDRILRSLNARQLPAVAGEVTNREQISDVLGRYRPDVVVSAADRAFPSPGANGWLGSYSDNYQAAIAIIDAIEMVDPERRPFLIWVGSEDEYGIAPAPWLESAQALPTSAYGTSKLLATTIIATAIRTGIVEGCVVRLPIVFGEAQSPARLIANLVIAALQGRPLSLPPGDPMFALTYATDAAEWMIRLAGARGAADFPTVVNAPGYRPMALRKFVSVLDGIVPDGVVTETLLPSDRTGVQSAQWPDTFLAEQLGLGPVLETPLEHALTETFAWYHRNRWFWTVG